MKELKHLVSLAPILLYHNIMSPDYGIYKSIHFFSFLMFFEISSAGM